MMNKIKIRGNKIYTESTLCERQDVFEIVDKIPTNYFVWNIGENMGTDEYIPICELLHQNDVECHNINTNTLKAIKLPSEEVQKLRDAAGWGVRDLKSAKKALKSKRKGYISNNKRAMAALTIEIFERLSK